MPGGRPRKSLAQHIRDGTYRRDRHGPLPGEEGAGVAAGASGTGVRGEAVKLPESATQSAANEAKLWGELTKLLGETVTDRDAHMLKALCWWWAELLKIQEQLKTLTPGIRGYKDALTSAGIAIDKVDKIGQKFGLTPGDRAKLGVVNSGPMVAKVPTKSKSPV